jgi:hypothetical protein
MKKVLLLVAAMFHVGITACGSEASPIADELTLLKSAEAGLTVQNCTPLAAASVIASGSEAINPPNQTLDDRLDTRWSNLGRGSWIDYDLGSVLSLSGAAVAWHNGNTRTNTFTLSVSSDGVSYTQVYSGTSSGTTTAAETYTFPVRTARRLRITFLGNSMNDWASIAEARVCSGATAPPSTVVWRGDFETGDRSQWTRAQEVSPDRLQVVTSPLREGRYALKATVKQGDDPIDSSGNRNELVRMTREPVGSEYYYRWSTMFAPDFPSVRTWQLFTQWHHEGGGGSPPVEFYVYGEEMRFNIGGSPGTLVWRAPLVRGVWHDFILRVKWSPNPSVGFVELYHNGKLVLPKRYIATQFSGMLNYLKVGLYRNETISQVGVVYHDGWVMGRTLADVQPQSTVASPSAAGSWSVAQGTE